MVIAIAIIIIAISCWPSFSRAPLQVWYNADSNDLHTLVRDINDCLEANGEEPIKNLKRGKMARLVAAYREQFNGEPMAVDVSHPGAVEWYEKGKSAEGMSEEDGLALTYEIAACKEAAGDDATALDGYMDVYASNARYRDVGDKVQSLKAKLGR